MISQALGCVLEAKRWIEQNLCLQWDYILVPKTESKRNKLQYHFVFGGYYGDPKEEQLAQNWGIRRWCLSSEKNV